MIYFYYIWLEWICFLQKNTFFEIRKQSLPGFCCCWCCFIFKQKRDKQLVSSEKPIHWNSFPFTWKHPPTLKKSICQNLSALYESQKYPLKVKTLKIWLTSLCVQDSARLQGNARLRVSFDWIYKGTQCTQFYNSYSQHNQIESCCFCLSPSAFKVLWELFNPDVS